MTENHVNLEDWNHTVYKGSNLRSMIYLVSPQTHTSLPYSMDTDLANEMIINEIWYKITIRNNSLLSYRIKTVVEYNGKYKYSPERTQIQNKRTLQENRTRQSRHQGNLWSSMLPVREIVLVCLIFADFVVTRDSYGVGIIRFIWYLWHFLRLVCHPS